ncbi:type II secretion system F family protein [Salinactinospora qingdaonensis]|uniref:Type II secretion system protein GspF domain-containing protein n=1 Tax=Salinactinospora qingdaonensis TaxID=702744 RepID=A0ABP7F3K9_9ACTN
MAPVTMAFPLALLLVAASVWLALGDGRSGAEHRLAALLPPAGGAQRPRRRDEWRPGGLVRLALAGLPVFTLSLLLGLPVGPMVGVAAGAVVWRRLGGAARRRVRERQHHMTAALPVAVDLLVACLRSGGTVPASLEAVARAVGGPLGGELGEVAQQLRLGAEPAVAWRAATGPPELHALARTLTRASATGAPAADLLQRHATDCRRSARARALALSQRLGVLVVAPLGLCFLPAFVLIGVVPLAVGLLPELRLS